MHPVTSFSTVPWWNGLGSQPAVYEQDLTHQLKSSPKGNSAIDDKLTSFKEKPPHFTISPGKGAISADTKKYQLCNATFMMPASVAEQDKHFELGFQQPRICARTPYGEQYYGVLSTYASQLTGRAMLPLNSTTDEGTVFVNAKQYNGILRRRQYRAKVEQENKAKKNRKPFLHLSRHLHAMRRPRGCGGRFLNRKDMIGSNNKGKGVKKNGGGGGGGGQFLWASVLSDSGNSSSPSPREESNGGYRSKSTNSCSEVTSMYFMGDNHHFLMNHHLQTVPNTMNAGHGIALHNNWIAAAAAPADTCCNLEV